MKQLFVLASVLALLLLAGAAQALVDNYYFTIPPDSSRCFLIRLPIDLGTLARGYYTLNMSSDFPMNLVYIKTFAEAVNIVRVPICFYTPGKQDGDFTYYTIRAASSQGQKQWTGGICVSEIDDVESRSPQEGQSPCDLINGYEDLFYTAFIPSIQWVQPNSRINYTLFVQSMNQLTINIDFEGPQAISPNRVAVEIPEGGGASSVTVEVQAPASGTSQIAARSRVLWGDSYCDLPFCEMRANATLIVGDSGMEGSWQLFIFPQFLSVDFAHPIPYTIFLDNQDRDKIFDLQILLPPGLSADWESRSVFIRKGERKELRVNITPQSPEAAAYTITFLAGSEGVQQILEAYLSVREIESDISRRWNSLQGGVDNESLRQAIDFEVDRFIQDYRITGFDYDDYIGIDDLLDTVEEGDEPPIIGPGDEPKPLNPLFIALPVVAVIAALLYIFYRKSRSLEEAPESEEF